jgi:hypothetical protein
MAEPTDVKTREVLPGFHLVYLPLPMRPTIVNVYLVNGGSEWALIDTGMSTPDSMDAFRAAIDAVGCPPQAIRKIICTHHHPITSAPRGRTASCVTPRCSSTRSRRRKWPAFCRSLAPPK